MDVVKTSKGYAVLDDDRKVVSLHQDPNEAMQAMAELEYTPQPAFQPPASRTLGDAQDAAATGEPPATQAALMRSRQPLRTALDQPAPVEITAPKVTPPRIIVHKHGGTYVVQRDGQDVGRFENEDQAIETANLHKYAWSRGIDLGSNIPQNAPPLPKMARGQTGEAEEELGVTKRLTDPYYGSSMETRGLLRGGK